jgi:hypothetical protein
VAPRVAMNVCREKLSRTARSKSGFRGALRIAKRVFQACPPVAGGAGAYLDGLPSGGAAAAASSIFLS